MIELIQWFIDNGCTVEFGRVIKSGALFNMVCIGHVASGIDDRSYKEAYSQNWELLLCASQAAMRRKFDAKGIDHKNRAEAA